MSLFRFLLLVLVLFRLGAGGHVKATKRVDDSDDWSGGWGGGLVVKRNQREPIASTEYGEISRVRLSDGNQSYQLHFFTLEPNSLLLPVLLRDDMVFYVHTGSGMMSYLDLGADERENRKLRRGDIHRLPAGSVFFVQSDLDPERQKLRLHAVFGTSGPDFQEAAFEPYSSIRDLVLGFDKKVLQQIFEVPEEVIEEIMSGPKPPAIMQGVAQKKKTMWEMEQEYMGDVLGGSLFHFSNKQKKSKFFNIFSDKPDFENCNGWSTTVSRKKYSPLRHSQFGIFMVNLTTGSMMGPHWNPMATEIAVVLQGKGMVRVVCSSSFSGSECKHTRFSVEEGDVFVVPRYHPMAHMAFNNESFVFVGFSTSTKKNHPQFLAGKASVLRTLDKQIVERSFNVSDETLDRLLASQGDSVILKCTSCAEEEWRLMQEEIEKETEEEREREEEAARREEEKRREEEAERQRSEEQEREAQRRREQKEREAREREEAERRQREAEEEEDRKRKEEQQRQQEEREAQREEAAQRKREEEEEGKAREREEEEREAQRRQEAQRKREQEERERKEREAKEREQEAAQKSRQHEQEEREREQAGQREAEARREEEAARRAEEEAAAERREQQRRGEQQEDEVKGEKPRGWEGEGEEEEGAAQREGQGGRGGGEQETEEERRGGRGMRRTV